MSMRTITLTDRPPVRIKESEWPVIATGEGDSWASADYARHQQALSQGEIDQYHLRVRKHVDGRIIVYAVLDAATAWTGTIDYRAGVLLDDDSDVASAIRQVGNEAGLPGHVIRECIADLPVEVL